MKFLVDTADVEHKKMLDEGRKLAMTDNGLKAFLDDRATTGQSIL
jgi:hypothetical protein